MDGRAWQAAVHGVAKSQTRLSGFTFTFPFMHWRRKWQPTPVFLPRESQGWGSLVGCRLWGRTESDTTQETAVAVAASCIGLPGGSESKVSSYNQGDPESVPGWGRSPEGNGNPLQYSCLENPMDGGTWLAPVDGVAKTQT